MTVSNYLRRMKMARWIALFLAAIVIGSCFFPWVHVESRNILIGGFYSDVKIFGKPGMLQSIFCGIIILFVAINRIWSLRIAFFVSMISIAWAARNFLLIPACSGGECPVKLPALYVLLVASVLLTIMILLIKPRGAV